jgi:hypothetical protein
MGGSGAGSGGDPWSLRPEWSQIANLSPCPSIHLLQITFQTEGKNHPTVGRTLPNRNAQERSRVLQGRRPGRKLGPEIKAYGARPMVETWQGKDFVGSTNGCSRRSGSVFGGRGALGGGAWATDEREASGSQVPALWRGWRDQDPEKGFPQGSLKDAAGRGARKQGWEKCCDCAAIQELQPGAYTARVPMEANPVRIFRVRQLTSQAAPDTTDALVE